MARAQRAPQDVAIVLVREDETEEHITVERLLRAATTRGSALTQLGLGRGDVVVLGLGHGIDLITTFLGCLCSGVVPAISAAYVSQGQAIDPHAERLRKIAAASAATALVTSPAHAAALAGVGCRVLTTEQIGSAGNGAPAMPGADDDIAFLQYTSGSGGTPKGIAHKHATVLRYIESKRRAQPIGDDDVIVSWLPLYHDLGLVSGLLAPLVLGVRTVLISPFHWVRAPAVLFRAVHAHRGTLCFMPNFALNHCAGTVRDRDLDGVDLSCWKALVCGAEMVRADSLDVFAQRFAANGFRREALRAGYGMAEMVEGVTVTPPGDAPRIESVERAALQSAGCARPAAGADAVSLVSCGAPMPGVCLRIVDDQGDECDERRIGEISLRADFMLAGYHRQPAPALQNGWFHTGDLGYVSAGELFITGRKSDLIIVGGRNIQPEEIEQLADQVFGLRPGRSVAFGVADARTGSERVIIVCETAAACADSEKLRIERELRRRSMERLDVVLGDVRLVGKGWILKTSSGKHARPANREKYLAEICAR
jgi:acyl-CoA synthetase (AMP-forming)/AMP-acid ligase II